MSEPHTSGRSGDPAIKWLVLGSIVALITGVVFLSYLADEVRFLEQTGAGAVLGIGAAACLAFGAVALGPVGRAVGKRILGGTTDRGAIDDDLHDLRLQVEDLRTALVESQERLDFTERMLAGGKERAPEELH